MLALSLRTACRTEAQRRGVQLAARFEEAVAAWRANMDGSDQQAGFAKDLLALLRDHVAQQGALSAAAVARPAAQPKTRAPGEAARRRSHILVSEVFERYLATRGQGYDIDPTQETPSPSNGAKFTQTMRPNFRSTLRLITGVIGDKPLDAITMAEWRDFIAMITRLPRNHGKSSRERRGCLVLS